MLILKNLPLLLQWMMFDLKMIFIVDNNYVVPLFWECSGLGATRIRYYSLHEINAPV